ncbi:hypothetical protein BAE46_12335 [Glaciecola punicea]|nr:hypothetical protein BAE46_12335 [Glaciecola punicea]
MKNNSLGCPILNNICISQLLHHVNIGHHFCAYCLCVYCQYDMVTKNKKPIVNIAENFPNPEFHSKILQESQVSYTKVSEKAEIE